jgi:hypothetical protein
MFMKNYKEQVNEIWDEMLTGKITMVCAKDKILQLVDYDDSVENQIERIKLSLIDKLNTDGYLERIIAVSIVNTIVDANYVYVTNWINNKNETFDSVVNRLFKYYLNLRRSKMKYVFVGDIHGDYAQLSIINDYATEHGYTVVQVGDICDSKGERGFGREYQKKALRLAIRMSMSGHIFLYGNHDIPYLSHRHAEVYRCSGYSSGFSFTVTELLKKIPYKYAFSVDNILVTHAGLSMRMMESKVRPEDIPNVSASYLNDFIDKELTDNPFSTLLECGYARGGQYPFGGITWNDLVQEHVPIKGITQVFGHTAIKTVSKVYDSDYCVDSMMGDKSILLYDTQSKEFQKVLFDVNTNSYNETIKID